MELMCPDEQTPAPRSEFFVRLVYSLRARTGQGGDQGRDVEGSRGRVGTSRDLSLSDEFGKKSSVTADSSRRRETTCEKAWSSLTRVGRG